MINKKGQEEMVGFALIIIIVAIILLVFLSISLKNPSKVVESYEVEGFIQAFLQYTTACDGVYSSNYLTVRETIFECRNQQQCINGQNSCEILNSTLQDIMDKNWNVGEDSPVKGYQLIIKDDAGEIENISEGEVTNNYKSATQNFVKSGELIEITVNIYY